MNYMPVLYWLLGLFKQRRAFTCSDSTPKTYTAKPVEKLEGSDSNYLSLNILGGQQFSGEERNAGMLGGCVFASWTKSSSGIVSKQPLTSRI